MSVSKGAYNKALSDCTNQIRIIICSVIPRVHNNKSVQLPMGSTMGGDQCQNGGSNLEGGDFKLRGGILQLERGYTLQ